MRPTRNAAKDTPYGRSRRQAGKHFPSASSAVGISIASVDANAPSLGDAAGVFLVLIAAPAALVLAPGAASAHFHHSYLGFVGSCLCTLATDTSMVAQAMLLGIYLHGTSLFGVERVFYPEVGDAEPY